ncbi:protein translocase subunit SecA-like [Mastacembelus armatus]|uniref:protein translocase subunit SecA-like n=1 Tax=Mastacembelus armatus TaxID=205130 RepID=UPI000E456F5B|nr:protein translocase subunit SecA-like [Mastacembelus armatus]
MDESDTNPTAEELTLKKLQGLVTNIKWSKTDVADLFRSLLERFQSAPTNTSGLSSWMLQILHCIEINYITPSWKYKTGKTLIQLVQDKTVTDENLKKCLADDTEKQLDEIIEEIRQQKLNQVDEKLLLEVRDTVSSVNEALTSINGGSQLRGLKKDVLTLCRAAEQTHFRPRLTQIVSLCLMALSKTGRLIQVGTGEGKTCIVAMFAAFRAMRGEKVDIMSSSPVLAERDMREWKTFYERLNITVNSNINKQGKDLQRCYQCQVVYGTAEEFAGDWLKQHFHRMDTFGQREIQCAVVDEVDSLMLDKGLHVVYLSEDMPALQHLNPLLALIWATVNQYMHSQHMYSDEESVVRAVEATIKEALRFTPCELNKDQNICYIPGFLSDLVKSKLKVWIEKAFHAHKMKNDHEYVIEKHGLVPVDYSCTGVVENFMKWSDGLHQFLEMKHQCKLSDMTAITNYMSNVGLLQKYGDQIFGISGTLGQQAETETLQKIYNGITTCQIPTFKRRKLFEVEGVVVTDEQEWIEKICDVVTAQTKPNLYRKERAVLVICESIKRAKTVHDALGNKVCNKKLYINNNSDNTAVFSKHVEAGKVIIATNLAGRGTDLKVSDTVNRAGGLFVVQTFLPKNARVEAQAFGRTARQGSPGSAQLIICTNHLSKLLQLLVLRNKLLSELFLLTNIIDVTPLYQNLFVMQLRLYQKHHSYEESKVLTSMLAHILNEKSEIKIAKQVRDELVAEELSSYLERDITKIKRKEELFSQYLVILDDLYKRSNNKPAQSDVSALNEFWGMWLLTSFNETDSLPDLKNRLSRDLDRARLKLSQRQSPSSNVHHYTVFGNELREKGLLADSIQMYSKAIQEDHCWAAIAYYNRAFASLTQQGKHQDQNCIIQALEDLQNALKSVELYCEEVEVTCRYSTQDIKELHSCSVTRFDEDMIARSRVLWFLMKNINEAIKKLQRARDHGEDVKVEKKLINFLVPSTEFFPLAKKVASLEFFFRFRDPLWMYQLMNDPSSDILMKLESLKSLGLTHVYTLNTRRTLFGFCRKIRSAVHHTFNHFAKRKWFFK